MTIALAFIPTLFIALHIDKSLFRLLYSLKILTSLLNEEKFAKLIAWKDNNPNRTEDAEIAVQALVKLTAIDGLALCEHKDIADDESLVNFLKEINSHLEILATSCNGEYLEDYHLNTQVRDHLSKMQPQDLLIHLKAVHVKVEHEKLGQPGTNGISAQNRLEELLKTPFGQPFPALSVMGLGRMADLAAQGRTVVNVHDGKREKKTAEALELLRRHQDEKDQENARHELFSALSDCVNDKGERVCPYGKASKVFVAVLQGRLKEVNIDGLVFNAPPSEEISKNSLEIFFTRPANQEIYNREDTKNIRKDLLSAGQKFCLENPKVDPSVFFGLLATFMANDPDTFG